MLGLYSYSEISHALLNIAHPDILLQHHFTAKGLRLALQARAQQLQPELPLWDTETTVLVSSERVERDLRELFAGQSNLNDLGQSTVMTSSFDPQERIFKLNQIRQALDLLKNLDPNLYEIFNVVIGCIFTSSSSTAGGGTSSGTPGVIWANLRNHWSTWDKLEFLVHELTHNILFFDEFSQLHYLNHNDLARPETFAQSAVLMRKRPLDKVLHSILVGISILNLRANALFQQVGLSCPLVLTKGVHPDSQTLNQQVCAAIASIEENEESLRLLSSRGQELLERAKKRAHEFSNISASLHFS